MRSQQYCTVSSTTSTAPCPQTRHNPKPGSQVHPTASQICITCMAIRMLGSTPSRLECMCMLFTWKVLNGRKSPMLRQVVESVLLDPHDPWTIQVLNLCGTRDMGFLNNKLATVRKSMADAAVADVLSFKPAPTDFWIKLRPYVNDSSLCGVLCKFRAGDAGLGNRRPNQFGHSYKSCPLFSPGGIAVPLNECHVAPVCPSVGFERRVTGILDFTTKYPSARKNRLLLRLSRGRSSSLRCDASEMGCARYCSD